MFALEPSSLQVNDAIALLLDPLQAEFISFEVFLVTNQLDFRSQLLITSLPPGSSLHELVTARTLQLEADQASIVDVAVEAFVAKFMLAF